MNASKITRVAILTLVLAIGGSATTVQAQSWKDRVKKEGAKYIKKALGDKTKDSTATAPKSTTKNTAGKKTVGNSQAKLRHEQEPQVKFFFTKEQVETVRQFKGALITYIGKKPEPCMAGTLESNWKFPAHTKSEREQNQWNDKRMERLEGDESHSNAGLVREIAASKKWIEDQDKMGGPVREFMYSLPTRLDEELYERALIINEYVELMTEIINAQPDEDREADRAMHMLETKIKNPRYQRATATSMEPLSKYLTKETIEFFAKRGGLANAHSAARLTWPANKTDNKTVTSPNNKVDDEK
ncbi:MAG: hypothetical protein ACI4TS_06940 [Bacteroidaceae bacterium]